MATPMLDFMGFTSLQTSDTAHSIPEHGPSFIFKVAPIIYFHWEENVDLELR